MYQLLVNDRPEPGAAAWKTWGNLLRGLDERCAAQGRVVTAVRFDGVEQPDFRGLDLASCGLDDLATVEVEAVRPRDLLESTIEQTLVALATLQKTAERLGGEFRAFDVSSANAELGELAESLGNMVSIAGTISQAIGVELSQVRCGSAVASEIVDELLRHANALISAREIGDWIAVADVVEYDIAPCLRRWPTVFQALRSAVSAATPEVAAGR
jgi:hypothetical protein